MRNIKPKLELSANSGFMPRPEQDKTAGFSRVELIEFGQLLRALLQNYRLVLGVGAVSLIVVLAVTLAGKMDFRSSGRLYLGELDTKQRAAANSNDLDLSGSAEGRVGGEIEIIKSRALVGKAVLASGLNVTIIPVGQEPPRFWQWLASERDPNLLDPALREVRAVETSLAPGARQGQSYVVKFLSAEEYELSSAGRALGRGKLGQPLSVAGLTLKLISGFDRQPKAGAAYNLVVRPVRNVTDGALSLLEVTAPRSSAGGEPISVLTLEFTAGSPRLAMVFLDQLMVAYLEERQAWKTEDATAAETFITSELNGLRKALDSLQGRVADYRSSNRVVVLESEAKAMIEQIAQYEQQRVAARLEVAALNDITKALQDPNAPLGAYLVGEASDTVLQAMGSSLSQARQRLTELQTRFNAAAPDVRDQQAQIDAQLESIRNYVGSRRARAQENLAAMSGIIAQFEGKLKTVPGAELGLAQLSRESEVFSRTYSFLLERQQQAAIVKASRLSKNRVLDAPQAAQREDSPNLMLRCAIGLLGILLGAGLVVLRTIFSPRLQNEADALRVVGNAPVLGKFPRRKRGPDALAQVAVDVATNDPDCRFVEAFRSFRTKLYRLAEGGENGTVVLVTSPSAGDGKTTCVHWLASVLAADGNTVLTVDADLRKRDTRVEGVPLDKGLRAVLEAKGDWYDSLERVPFGGGEYSALAAGGTARPEVLSSPEMRSLLGELRRAFDFVVLDAPAFPFVSDAFVLAAEVDIVISVIRPMNTGRVTATEHAQLLSPAKWSYGVVINDAGRASGASKPVRKPGGFGSGKSASGGAPPVRGRRRSWWVAAAVSVAVASSVLLSGYARDESAAPLIALASAGKQLRVSVQELLQ
jgi:tyrosine-protein kinase Etk/Wzc